MHMKTELYYSSIFSEKETKFCPNHGSKPILIKAQASAVLPSHFGSVRDWIFGKKIIRIQLDQNLTTLMKACVWFLGQIKFILFLYSSITQFRNIVIELDNLHVTTCTVYSKLFWAKLKHLSNFKRKSALDLIIS